MALNPDLVNFFLSRISNSTKQTFGSEVSHLFEHLRNEVKDNPVYDQYELNRPRWKNWEEQTDDEIEMPTNFEDAKFYVYDIYKRVAEKGSEGYDLVWRYFPERNSTINDRIQNVNDQLLQYLTESLKDIIGANPEQEDQIKRVSGNTVFIIHGHDGYLKTQVQLLLQRAGVNSIVLHEQPDMGRNIIEKLIEETDKANYAIALLSPDEELKDGSKRARQNVILEIGYFLGKLDKSRVKLVKKGDTEIPSDLSGILYENYDEAGSWKIKLCKDLQAAGIFVDLEAVIKSH
jgi:predicted nucleotide-binding protein